MAIKKKIIPSPDIEDDKKEKTIIDKIVNQLKPQIKESIEELRKDLYNDFKENIKVPVPSPQVQAVHTGMPDLSKLGDILKDGNLDMSKISQLMSTMQTPGGATDPNTPPQDINKMSPGQIEYMKMQKQERMMGMILPLLLQQQPTANPMIGEMMNRIFLEKINSSLHMDKAMLNMMVRSVGGAMPKDTGLTTPVSDMISNVNSSPLGGGNPLVK